MRPSYIEALEWIARERPGGGWPPRNPQVVSGWLLVRFVAAMFHRSVRDVADDLIKLSLR